MKAMKLPRFSLRTVFVAIALLSIPMGWMAYQLNWIRQRHAALDSEEENKFPVFVGGFSLTPTPAPWQLRIFGEQGVGDILMVNANKWPELKQKLANLFPEAKIANLSDSDQQLGSPPTE
jgi:hypothetical protein